MNRFFALAGCCLFGSILALYARPTRIWTPEELEAKAQTICTGTPTKIVVTNQKSQIQLPGNPADPVRTVIATVKVAGVEKGEVRGEIEIRYPALDYDALKAIGIRGIGNGPIQIDLSIGKSYRFYLNPVAGKSWYVGALAGEFDDGFAVQRINSGEAVPAQGP